MQLGSRPRMQIQLRQLRHVAPELSLQVQFRLRLRRRLHLRPQIVQVDRHPVPVVRRQILHLRLQIARRQVKRNRPVVHDSQSVHQLHFLRLQIQQRVLERGRTRARMLRNRLVRLPVLIDDQVHMRLFHPQQVQPDMRGNSGPTRMRKEAENLHPDEDPIGRDIRHLPRPFEPMDHQPIRLDRQMPKVERDLPQVDLPPGRILEHTHDFLANAPLEVSSRRVPRGSRQHDQDQRQQSADRPRRNLADVDPAHMEPSPLLLRQPRLLGTHGATSPGFMICTVPCARRLFNQSCSSLLTLCCSRTS